MSQRVCVIGCGYWGKNLVRNFHALGALGKICENDENGRKTAHELAPDVPVVESLDDAVADVDGVVIATPAETHYGLAKAALDAGRDVFVEKPLALTFEEAQSLCELAESNGRMLMVGHVLEYHPAILKIRELIANGSLGRLQYVYSNRLNLGKIRREENILWSFAPHDVAIILRLIGDLPYQVLCCGGAYVQPNIADVTVTHLLFDNGVRAHIYVSWLHPFKEQRLVVIGDRAMVTFDDVNKELLLYPQRVEIGNDGPTPIKAPGEKIAFEAAEPLREECRAFLDAMASRKAPLTDGRSGLRTLRVLTAAQRSLITNGGWINLEG